MQSLLTALAVNAAVFSALFGLMLLARKLLAKRISAALQYALWAVVVLKLIIPFGFESDLSPFEWLAVSESAAAVEQGQADEAAPAQPVSGYGEPIQADMDTDQAQAPAKQLLEPVRQNAAAQQIAGTGSVPTKIDWAAAVLALWAAGAITAGTMLLLDTVKLRRRMQYKKSAPNARVMRLLEECRRELGLRRRVDVLMQPVLGVPLAMGAIRPVLVLPDDIETRSDAQIRHICLHELTHIKHGDLAVIALMNGLCAVYWFNPLVWLCFALIRKDMETACDCAVLDKLGAHARQSYIGTVLQFAGCERKRRLYAAMGMADGRLSMEKRIRGMFGRTRTHAKGRLAAACVALLLLAVSVLTACQPTPETPVVIGRQEDVLAAVEPVHPDDFEPIEAPGHISEAHDLSYAKIIYDADVAIPETTAYPVTEVEKRVLTEDDVLSYIDLFAGSNYEMYFGWMLTKDDYLALLTKVEPYKGTERVTKQIIKYLQELYEKATNGDVNRRISSLSDIPAEYAEHFPSVSIKTADGAISNFSWERDGNYFGYKRDDMTEACPASSVTNDQYTENMDGPVEHFRWKQPAEPDISQEDAYAVALRYRDAMGIDLELYSAEPCSFITGYVDKTTGWQFTFTRTISGLRTMDTIGTLGWRKETAPSYGSPWGEETLVMAVDKSGLFSLGWNGASVVSRTVADSAQLLDFDTIHQRITEQLGYNYAYPAEENGNYEIEVTQICLGISMISMENRMDIGEYLPTWYVTYRYKPENQGKDDWRTQQIMFSAIDGSYIEPRISVKDLMGDLDPIGSSSASDMNEV
jgi:beta-lactamase regulating signal transducer with metallopeptidase domain